MTVNFDYRNCTVEELADYVEISSAGRITQQLIYYQKREVVEMVEKIQEARRIVKKRKLIRLLEGM
jgi:hypothetical protein